MKKNFLSFVIATIFFLSFSISSNSADLYKFDPLHTNITWSANHLGFSSPSGKFTVSSGTILIDEINPQNSSVQIVIETNSVQTGLAKFDETLKGDNFLNSHKFPEANFVSKSVVMLGKNKAKVFGDLTLLGVTKSVTLEVRLNRLGINPMTQKKTAGFSAITSIKRSDFGMDFGIPGVSDTVKFAIEAEAIFDKSYSSTDDKPWIISKPESKIEFLTAHGGLNVTGFFEKFDGDISFDPNKLEASNVTININVASIKISDSNAYTTLKTSDWLDFVQFPKATFTANKFIKISNNNFIAKGNLTLKGKTLPLDLNFLLNSYSDNKSNVTGTTIIKRSDFDIGLKDTGKTSSIINEVKIKFTINASK